MFYRKTLMEGTQGRWTEKLQIEGLSQLFAFLFSNDIHNGTIKKKMQRRLVVSMKLMCF